MTRVALVGARGIGAVHARVLAGLGAELAGVVGTSLASARESADALQRRHGIEVPAFADLEDCIAQGRPEALVIASPADVHRVHLAAAHAHELPALCEKPLFWPGLGDVSGELAAFREELERRPYARFLLNLANAHLMEAVLDELSDRAGRDGDFAFEFHTLGRATWEALAADLLPHALSLLARLGPLAGPFEELSVIVEEHRFRACCVHAGRRLRFDLVADPAGRRQLAFAVGDRRWTRVQEGSGATYRVALLGDDGRRHELEDPFVTRARRFLDLCEGRADWAAARSEALENQSALVRFLRDTPRAEEARAPQETRPGATASSAARAAST